MSEQPRKNLNEVPMNGESHLDGIALGIKEAGQLGAEGSFCCLRNSP